MTGEEGRPVGWVRPAWAADVSAITQVVEAAYVPWVPIVGTRPAPLSSDHAALVAEGVVHVAGIARTPPAGSIDALVVLRPGPGALCVENLAVHPRSQGRGLGSRLLAFAEEEARRLGMTAVRLYTHERMTSNVRLYARVGYVETGREEVGTGRLVHMSKTILEASPGCSRPMREREGTP